MEEGKSFYKTAGRGRLYEQEAPVEQDKSLMRSYYPQESALAQAFVEDACDRLDYEGSFIYDEYPDKFSIERTCREICRQMQERTPVEAMARRRHHGNQDILGELVGALFCQEVHCRRCRRNRCRQFW